MDGSRGDGWHLIYIVGSCAKLREGEKRHSRVKYHKDFLDGFDARSPSVNSACWPCRSVSAKRKTLLPTNRPRLAHRREAPECPCLRQTNTTRKLSAEPADATNRVCRRYHRGMAWIRTVRPDESEAVRAAMMGQRSLYPVVYGQPMDAGRVPQPVLDDSITLSHSLIPKALEHAFATFGVLLDPALPLSRREHEMIATTVSVLNKCFY